MPPESPPELPKGQPPADAKPQSSSDKQPQSSSDKQPQSSSGKRPQSSSGKQPQSPLPPDWFERFEHGLAEFNQGKYYDCHETLERCWQEQGLLASPMQDPHREWVQGIIQISVAYHHLERDNVKGALKLFTRGFARIKKFPLISYPLELGPFEATVKSTIDELEALGEPSSAKIKGPFPKIEHK